MAHAELHAAERVQGAVTGRPVQAAIHARRTTRSFLDKPVPREVTRRLLEAAVQAPNHRRTIPWRFFVVDAQGRSRDALADLAYESALGRQAASSSDDAGAVARAEAKRREVQQVPLLVIGFSVPGRSPEETKENYAAVACAFENLMLAAHEEGLASGWSTGGICGSPRLASLAGADASWEMVGALYLGWPDPQRPPSSLARSSAEAVTTWLTS